MYKQPKVSVVVPIHDMKDGDKFLWRLVNSLTEQTFKDWELIITKEGKMAENTNAGIKRARGEIIKIIYLDDYLAHPKVLQCIVNRFKIFPEAEWLISATNDNLYPEWTDDIETGNNKLGSPSALAFRNHFEENVMFDKTMSWLLDCDFYKRMQLKYGVYPTILGVPKGLREPDQQDIYINIGKGDHQMTHILTDEEKLAEHKYMNEKYA